MKNIHEPAVLQEIINRINNLKADSPRQWGKMNPAQMMAHCSNAIENNLGDRKVKQRFMGKLFGKMAKKSVVNEQPIKQGIPTDSSFMIKNDRDFNTEKQRLVGLLTRLSKSDPNDYSKNLHPFFGMLTPAEWNILNYKHFDHHLRQFGA
jgi:hypothetical protein